SGGIEQRPLVLRQYTLHGGGKMKKKSLLVFGTRYSVRAIKDLAHNNGILGFCDKRKKQIGIDAGLTPRQQVETLLHELAHAVFHEVALDQAISHGLEEVTVENIAKAIYQNFDVRL